MDTPVLSVKNLSIDLLVEGLFRTFVSDLSFSLNRGQTLGIVGESGSGKSLTSLAIMGLLPHGISKVKTKELLLNGEINLSTAENSEKARGSKIAMIFQEPMTSLNPVYSCGEQLTETLKRHLKLSSTKARETAIAWFSKVKLPHPERVFKAYPHELSGGQRQRVMIAMALCCKPDLLIADEPTTALDVTVQKAVLDLINDLQKELGTAVIFISHDLGVVKHLADEVLVLNKGLVEEQNNTSELFKNPKTAYTKGLLKCKPENSNKTHYLTTVKEMLLGTTETQLREDFVLKGSQVILEVRDLNKTYFKKGLFKGRNEGIQAVKNVSFTITKGQTVGLVGESGCGKSTLSKILSGLLEADEGVLIFNETDISNYSKRQWMSLRGKIQFIFQDPYGSLNPKKNVYQTLKEVLDHHQPEIRGAEQRALCEELLDEVGLSNSSLYKFPHEFSGGQRQRLVISRALAAKPEFIIADESVSALDVSVQAQVLNLLNRLKAKHNLTYLFISHDLAVINYMSDYVLVMKDGEIIEQGLADKIMVQPEQNYTRELLKSVY